MCYRASRPPPARRLHTVCRIEVRKLDVAKGRDGFLRGRPEPVVVLGTYVLDPSALRLVERRICRFHRPRSFPSSVAPEGAHRVDLLLDYAIPATIVCAGFALEQDTGADVAEVAAAIEQGDRLLVAPPAPLQTVPIPLEAMLEPLLDRDAPARVDLWIDGQPAAERFVRDDWVGCSVLAFPGQARRRSTRRMHFRSPTGHNDWSMVLELRLASPRPWPEP